MSNRVFISYSHESPTHVARITNLAQALSARGIPAWIDRFEVNPGAWSLWMYREIVNAHIVLLICTKTYVERFDGKAASNVGHGVTWEGEIVRTCVYQTGSRKHEKFIPILVEPNISNENKSVFMLDEKHEVLSFDRRDQPTTESLDTLIIRLLNQGTSREKERESRPLNQHHPDIPADNEMITLRDLVNGYTETAQHLAVAKHRLATYHRLHLVTFILSACAMFAIVWATARMFRQQGEEKAVSTVCSSSIENSNIRLWTLRNDLNVSSAVELAVKGGAKGILLSQGDGNRIMADERGRSALRSANEKGVKVIAEVDQNETVIQCGSPNAQPLHSANAPCFDFVTNEFEPPGALFTVNGEERPNAHPLAAWPCTGTDSRPTAPFALRALSLAGNIPDNYCESLRIPGWLAPDWDPDQPSLSIINAVTRESNLKDLWLVIQSEEDHGFPLSSPCNKSAIQHTTRAEIIARVASLKLPKPHPQEGKP